MRLLRYIYLGTLHLGIYVALCHVFLFNATWMATVGEQWLIHCRKLCMTWWTLETTTTCRSLLYTTPTGTPLRRTVSNTTASEPSENRFHQAYAMLTYIYIYIYIYIRQALVQEIILKYILITPASDIYALFVLNTKEWKNQYCTSHYGSTFEAVLHCGITDLPRSSSNIFHAPGLAQARPHDAMHLSVYYLFCCYSVLILL